MKVVITEKPSVARDIAVFLGAKNKYDGYFEGNGFQVTWAFGHLVTLKEPDEYDPLLKRWSLATLPFIPPVFQLKLIKNPGVAKQFKIIEKLIKTSTELIEATDAGREGELIFRYILSLAAQDSKSFKRLWLSSLTDEAMKKGFENLRSGSEYDSLYEAARCRSESDWIVGLNATRNFTVRYGKGSILWSVGRVQTPVLALLALRHDEIAHFVSEPFWELKTKYKETVFKWKGSRFKKKEEAEKLLSKVKGHPFTVQNIESKQEKTPPPFLYDLTELQRDMNKKYGMSANNTLEIAQKLYESKAISYPRTDSKFLSKDMKGEVVHVLHQLEKIKPAEIAKLNFDDLSFTARIINDAKVEDHHAIIPTGKIPSALDLFSQRVFDAIATRLIAAFYPTCIKNITTVEGIANQESFQVKGTQIVSSGWMALYSKEPEEGEVSKEEEQMLPIFTLHETGPHEPLIKQGKTEPPKHFTEASLLGAMETAGKFVEDEQLKEALKQKGLGTPATRAAIIETLLKRGYVARDKKAIKITNLGRYLIAIVQDPSLKSPELTGEWEFKLKEVEKGRLSSKEFMEEIVRYTKNLIHESSALVNEKILGPCPCCKRPVIEGKKGYGCSGWKEGCSFVIWKEYKGKILSIKQVQSLIQRKILLDPLLFDNQKVILCLTEKGAIIEVFLPEIQEKKKPAHAKRN